MSSRTGFGALVAGLALFTVISTALVWYIWTQLTELLEGHVHAAPDLLALLLLVVLAWLLRRLGTWVRRYQD